MISEGTVTIDVAKRTDEALETIAAWVNHWIADGESNLRPTDSSLASVKNLIAALRDLRRQASLPDWDDIRGLAPDATGALSSEDFVRNMRDA